MNRKPKDPHVKLGMFYYNPDDPNEFVERRNGMGTTINFASKAGRRMFMMVLLPGTVVIVLVMLAAIFLGLQ